MKHSPTPWKIDGHMILDKHGNIVLLFDSESTVDATYLVRAVNTYARIKFIQTKKRYGIQTKKRTTKGV